jgi:hypothetical protein
MNNSLQSAQSIASAYLTNFAKSADFWQDFEVAFGHNYNKQVALNIKNSLANKGFTPRNCNCR